MSDHEKEYQEIIKHNRKIVTEYYHLDYDKFLKQHMQELGKYFRSITAGFSDKEMYDAMVLGCAIINKTEPEDGLSYEELAFGLNIYDDDVKESENLPEGYKEKIDRLLYVLQYMAFEFDFNTTHEKGDEGGVNIIPVVKLTKKIRDSDGKIKKCKNDEAYEVIFNGCSKKYAAEQLKKLGLSEKISKDTLLPKHLRHKSATEIAYEQFGEKYKMGKGRDELFEFAGKVIETLDREGHLPLKELVHILFPETKDMHYGDKTSGDYDPALNPYLDKIKDALVLIRISTNTPAENIKFREKLMKEREK